MKVCFVGMGSIAIKHIDNLRLLVKDLTIHAYRTGKSNFGNEVEKLADKQIFNLDNLDNDYDAIFICNPTSRHLESLRAFKERTRYIFLEKPAFDKAISSIEMQEFCNTNIMVACPLRFDSGIEYAKSIVDKLGNPTFCRIISSSYLPEWRAEDYRLTYSASKELGGGVDIDLIHEVDYMVHLFGFPNCAQTTKGKFSNLEIDTYDLVSHIFEYNNMLVEMHLDYIGRKNQRYLELNYNDCYYKIDLIARQIERVERGVSTTIMLEDNSFRQREIINFLNFCIGKNAISNDLTTANKVLALAKK